MNDGKVVRRNEEYDFPFKFGSCIKLICKSSQETEIHMFSILKLSIGSSLSAPIFTIRTLFTCTELLWYVDCPFLSDGSCLKLKYCKCRFIKQIYKSMFYVLGRKPFRFYKTKENKHQNITKTIFSKNKKQR